jgi:hypothetical protein
VKQKNLHHQFRLYLNLELVLQRLLQLLLLHLHRHQLPNNLKRVVQFHHYYLEEGLQEEYYLFLQDLYYLQDFDYLHLQNHQVLHLF